MSDCKAPAGIIGGRCARTSWQTPERLLEPVREYFGGVIPLDVATAPNNPTRARAFYCPADAVVETLQSGLFAEEEFGERVGHDALELPWGPQFFCNPPYGTALRLRWLPRVAEQACAGAEGFMLLSCARWEQECLHEAMAQASAVCWIKGRVDFINPVTGDAVVGNTYANMFLAFNVSFGRFAECFGKVGWCYRLAAQGVSDG